MNAPEKTGLFLGIDGGSTKTGFLLIDGDERVVASATLGPSNPNTVGRAAALSVIREGARAVCAGREPPRSVFAGVSGLVTAGFGPDVEAALREEFPDAAVGAGGDILNVIHAAGCTGRCAAAIMGTGSVVYAHDGAALHRFGGWGPAFDEALCGFTLGRAALRACLEADAGLSPRTALGLLAAKRLGGGSAVDALSSAYGENGTKFIASFAPDVFAAADAGDASARAIIRAAAAETARLVKRALETPGCGGTLVLSGGLLARGDMIIPVLRENIGGVRIAVPSVPQTLGAARAAMRLAV